MLSSNGHVDASRCVKSKGISINVENHEGLLDMSRIEILVSQKNVLMPLLAYGERLKRFLQEDISGKQVDFPSPSHLRCLVLVILDKPFSGCRHRSSQILSAASVETGLVSGPMVCLITC
jgi:hypothetical protein